MDPKSVPLTGFVTPIAIGGARHFEWTVLPFGLRNTPPIFQRVMNHVLQDCDNYAIVYMDDVLIFSRTREEHRTHIEQVLRRLHNARMRCNAEKCEWVRDSVTFLGHVLSRDGIKAHPKHQAKIAGWECPLKNKRDVQSFLGIASYLRVFIKDYATKAAPLTDLTKTGPFKWTEAATKAFHDLKAAVQSAPVVQPWCHSALTRVITDASDVGIGAALMQMTNNQWHVVEYFSRS